MTQEALKLALECAERCEAIDGMYSWSATITAIKEALAQTQEPVANRALLERTLIAMEGVIDVADRKTDEFDALRACIIELTLMLYTTPPQRTWVGLSDGEYTHITDSVYHQGHGLVAYYKAIEAKLKELNT